MMMMNPEQTRTPEKWNTLIKANLNIAEYANMEMTQGNLLNSKLILDSLLRTLYELPADLPPHYQ